MLVFTTLELFTQPQYWNTMATARAATRWMRTEETISQSCNDHNSLSTLKRRIESILTVFPGDQAKIRSEQQVDMDFFCWTHARRWKKQYIYESPSKIYLLHLKCGHEPVYFLFPALPSSEWSKSSGCLLGRRLGLPRTLLWCSPVNTA